jgi:hypothetical protein
MTQLEPGASRPPRVLAVAVVLAATAILGVVVVLHLTASAAASRAERLGSLAERLEAARLAATIEPWNPAFRLHVRELRLWERGQQLLDVGDYNGSVDALREAYADDVGNNELLALFKQAQATQALETNRKAHLQHGHEGPGGTLRPEDIER